VVTISVLQSLARFNNIYFAQQTLISSHTSSSTTVACTTCRIGTIRQWPSFIDRWLGTVRQTCYSNHNSHYTP